MADPSNRDARGYPPNSSGMQVARLVLTNAVQAYQLPDMQVPEGMELALKAMPGNAGQIWIGNSAATCTKNNSSWPLIANESIGYQLRNAHVLWASATIAGDSLILTAEKV